MSFSTDVKSDLARIEPKNKCCALAELLALTKLDGTIKLSAEEDIDIHFMTENAAVARKIIKFLKDMFGVQVDIAIQRKIRLKKNNVYIVRVPPQVKSKEVLAALDIKMGQNGLKENWQGALLKRKCCRKAFLRGAFLGGGSVNNPEADYHFEILTRRKSHAKLLLSMMQSMDLNPKLIKRKNWYMVYLKESEQIINFLNIVGAHTALLQFENARIIKEMRNNVNRIVNCETANLNKTIDAGVRQVENIKLLISKIGLENLPGALQEIASLRLDFPDISLKELGQLLDPAISKSGVNHRLRRLEEMAERYKEGEVNSNIVF